MGMLVNHSGWPPVSKNSMLVTKTQDGPFYLVGHSTKFTSERTFQKGCWSINKELVNGRLRDM